MLKKTIIFLVKFIVSFGLILFLFHKLGLNNVIAQISAVNYFWFLVGVFIFGVSNLFGSYQWHLLLQVKGIDLPVRKVASFYHVGLFFNNFLVGYIGGDAFRIYDISKASGDNSSAISSVFFDRFIGFAIMTTMALAAALYWVDLFPSNKILITTILIFCYWVSLLILLFNEKMIKRLGWIFKRILTSKINTKIKEIYLGINTFKNHKKDLIKVIFISLVTQSLRILVHYLAARSIGVKISFVYFLIFIPIIALLSSLPISIGGLGVRESSATALFSQIWDTPADIVAFEFLAFLIGIICTIPGGFIFMLRRDNTKPLINQEIVR